MKIKSSLKSIKKRDLNSKLVRRRGRLCQAKLKNYENKKFTKISKKKRLKLKTCKKKRKSLCHK